jgi:hypothetical protein
LEVTSASLGGTNVESFPNCATESGSVANALMIGVVPITSRQRRSWCHTDQKRMRSQISRIIAAMITLVSKRSNTGTIPQSRATKAGYALQGSASRSGDGCFCQAKTRPAISSRMSVSCAGVPGLTSLSRSRAAATAAESAPSWSTRSPRAAAGRRMASTAPRVPLRNSSSHALQPASLGAWSFGSDSWIHPASKADRSLSCRTRLTFHTAAPLRTNPPRKSGKSGVTPLPNWSARTKKMPACAPPMSSAWNMKNDTSRKYSTPASASPPKRRRPLQSRGSTVALIAHARRTALTRK